MIERSTIALNDPEVVYKGLSTDTKPTVRVTNNDVFYELDTKKVYMYSALNINPITGDGWWEV